MRPFFSSINIIMAGGDEPLKESVLIGVGHIAKYNEFYFDTVIY